MGHSLGQGTGRLEVVAVALVLVQRWLMVEDEDAVALSVGMASEATEATTTETEEQVRTVALLLPSAALPPLYQSLVKKNAWMPPRAVA